MKPRFIAFIPGALWFLLIYRLLTMPASNVPSWPFLDKLYFDKWVHCGLFAVLIFLFSFPFKNFFPHYNILYLLISILGLLYGIGMEYVQKYFTTDRDFEILDMVADGVGCLFGFLFIQWQLKKKNSQNRETL